MLQCVVGATRKLSVHASSQEGLLILPDLRLTFARQREMHDHRISPMTIRIWATVHGAAEQLVRGPSGHLRFAGTCRLEPE